MESRSKIILDDGCIFGRGCFETILIKDKPIFLEEHINRLNYSLKTLNVDNELRIEDVISKIKELDIRNKALKIMVSSDNVVYKVRDIGYSKKHYEDGFKIKFSKIRKNEYSTLTYVKSLNYLENIIAKEDAKKDGFDESIFLNTNGFLAEGSVSNIFIIKDDIIYTPKVNCGILPGIIRGFLIDNIETIGYRIIQKNLTKEEVLNADGVFLTNSLMGVMKVSEIEKTKMKESPLINEIREFYLKFL